MHPYPNNLEAIFANFEGKWIFDRQITGSLQATAQGVAHFQHQTPASYLYYEEGRLHFTGPQPEAEFFRHYIYVLKDDRMDVLYGDGPQTGELYIKPIDTMPGIGTLPPWPSIPVTKTVIAVFTLYMMPVISA